MVDFKKVKEALKEKNMATRKDDPFEDDWGTTEENVPQSDDVPAPQEGRYPFLKPKDVIPARTGTLELVTFTSETSGFSDAIVVVTYRSKNYRLGFKTFSPDYKSLLKKFGTKRADWHGTLRYRVLPHNGHADGFISVRPA